MLSKRTALLGMLICLTGAVAFGQPAVIAPTAGGDIGLFTMTTADAPRAGQFTLGFYGWYAPRNVAEFYTGQPNNTRWITQYGATGSASLGLTNWWSIYPGAVVSMLSRLGFGQTVTTLHSQRHHLAFFFWIERLVLAQRPAHNEPRDAGVDQDFQVPSGSLEIEGLIPMKLRGHRGEYALPIGFHADLGLMRDGVSAK